MNIYTMEYSNAVYFYSEILLIFKVSAIKRDYSKWGV